MKRSSAVIHLVHTGQIALSEGGARGRCTVREIVQSSGGTRLLLSACHDEFEPGDIGWRFKRRRFDTLLSRGVELGDAIIRPWPEGPDNFLES